MAKKNPILEAYKQQLDAQYMARLDVTLQMCFDVAVIAANDVLKMGAGRAAAFKKAYDETYHEICMMLVEDVDDPDLLYSRSVVDKRLRDIVGEENFVPWDARYESAFDK